MFNVIFLKSSGIINAYKKRRLIYETDNGGYD